ncbi:hypothetical protein D3C81_1315120 [compost metagenome]
MFAHPQFAAQLQAIVAGHHDVEHDQVDGVGLEKAAHLPAIGDHRGAQAVFLQVVAHQFADLAVVVDDQNVIDMFHRCKPLSKGTAVQCIEPAVARLPAFVLQCICRDYGYTGTQKRDFFRGLYRCVSPDGKDTLRLKRASS